MVWLNRKHMEIGHSPGFPPKQDPRVLAEKLINRDLRESENEGVGQSLEKTFHLADFFVDTDDRPGCSTAIHRFVELLYGNPFLTPSRGEYAMYHANAAKARSSDPSRQVGCAIAAEDGSIVAVGTNDVPKAHGGLYWEGDKPDGRDFAVGSLGSRDARQREILEELVSMALRAKNDGAGARRGEMTASEIVQKMMQDPAFRHSKFNVIDVGRPVHAEMDAITTAARRGTRVQGYDLYTTTFPCHNCAKHIVAAGLASVRFIEPYPKSIAGGLYPDSIAVDDQGPDQEGKIPFVPFVGVAPKRYLDFYAGAGRKANSERLSGWNLSGARSQFARPF